MKQITTRISQKILMMMAGLLVAFSAAAQVKVTGTIVDPDGEPMIAATVLEKGTGNGVATDFDGNFTINVSNPDATLVVSYVGFQTQDVGLAGRSHVDIVMQYSAVVLNEVVAIGYGTVKKSDATGSVAVVKPDEIEAGIATSVQDMLVGQTPGVVVTTSGGPEGAANIRIRGGSSLSSDKANQPLIVVDGVPLNNDGVQGMSNDLAMISPENIESMTILKDASATAIYGSRASNGVIIITTKKGQSGAPTVSFAANFMVNQAAKIWDVLDAREFRDMIVRQYGEDSNAYARLGKHNTDWQNEILRTTFSSDYNLSVSGSAGVLPYRMSLTYTNSNGILMDSKMDRLTFGFNLSPKFFDNHLSVNANVKGYYLRNQFVNNPIGAAMAMDPTAPVYQDYLVTGGDSGVTRLYNGYFGIIDSTGKLDQNSTVNPVATIKDRYDRASVLRSNGNLQLDYSFHFLPELHANLNLGYDVSRTNENIDVYQNSTTAWLNHNKTGAGYQNFIYQYNANTLLEFYLNFRKDFEKIESNLDVTAGYSWQRFTRNGWNYGAQSEGDRATTYGYYNPTSNGDGTYSLNIDPATYDIINKNFVNDEIDPSGNYHWANRLQLLSFFGRMNYTFKDRYLLTLTLRGDATSRFAPDKRWGVFPALALGWKINEESFMQGARGWLNDWKLRLGWGVTGQQEVGSTCNYLPLYQIASPGSYYPTVINGQTVYVSPYYLMGYNPNLKWESTTTWNAAFDFGFLNNRITATVEGYLRKTKDLQSYVTIPAGSSTTNEMFMNIGSLENYGVEFNITARPIVTKNFTWTIGYNIGWNHSEITELYDNDAIIPTGGISGGNGNNVQAQRVGYAPYTFRLYQQVYDSNGNPLQGVYVDQNGDGQINEADLVMNHSRDPKVTMALNSQFRYKSWDFGFSLRANIGNYVYNNVASNNTDLTRLYDGTRGFGNIVKSDWYTTGSEYLSDYWLRNASFLRCDNITVGYQWENLLHNQLKIRLFGAVQNPFVITKYNGLDPEEFSGIDNNAYPRSRTYTLGVVATF